MHSQLLDVIFEEDDLDLPFLYIFERAEYLEA
jgi:hypothetical protein